MTEYKQVVCFMCECGESDDGYFRVTRCCGCGLDLCNNCSRGENEVSWFSCPDCCDMLCGNCFDLKAFHLPCGPDNTCSGR